MGDGGGGIMSVSTVPNRGIKCKIYRVSFNIRQMSFDKVGLAVIAMTGCWNCVLFLFSENHI